MENETIYAISGLAAGLTIGYAYYKSKANIFASKLISACEIVRRTYTNEGYESGQNNNSSRLNDRDELGDIREYLKKEHKVDLGVLNATCGDLGRKVEGIYDEQRAESNERRFSRRNEQLKVGKE